MSTRSIVGLAEGDGFSRGVYVHSDGYPTARGPALFAIATWATGERSEHLVFSALIMPVRLS